MTDPSALADAHAYVDDCLDGDARRAFEARLSEDQALRRRVEAWQTQNEAIRAAFGAPLSFGALAFGGPADAGPSSWMPSQISSRRAAFGQREPVSGAALGRSSVGRRDNRPRAETAVSPFLRIGLALLLSIGLLILSAGGGPVDPRGVLSEAGLSAFRAFGVDSPAGFDFSSNDARALAKWLSPRFWPAASEASLEIAGWTPVGVRIVPGTTSAAAFIVWENAATMRAGLLVEPLDAPPLYAPAPRDAGGLAVAAWTAGGRGFAAVAPDPKGLEALTRIGREFDLAR